MALDAGNYELPSKFEEQAACENCLAELTDKNKPKYCAGCGESGCQKCLQKLGNEYSYVCREMECCDRYYAAFKNLLDDVVDKLHKFISNCGDGK